MALSFSLLRDRLAARRASDGAADPVPPEGDGPLVWAHFCPGSATDGTALVLHELAARTRDLRLIASGSAEALADIAVTVDCPPEGRGAVRRFLNLWRPDVIVFSGPDPHPVLWAAAQARGTPMIAVEADPARHPISMVRLLSQFDFVHARAPDPRLSGPIHALVPLAATPPPPTANESDLDEMSALLASRPVWLSAATPEDEIDRVVDAHDHASKLSHRLLLILDLADPARGEMLCARLRRAGIGAVLRSRGDDIEADTQILIADDPGELALWVRLASSTYLGGSLGQGALCDPLIPAALGSVVIHGPFLGPWGDVLTTLDQTNGACAVLHGGALGAAIETLLAPDRAAEIAHEAWDIATRGAEASNLTLGALDRALASRDIS